MQFLPNTAKSLGVDSTDDVSSIQGAIKYMELLYNKFGNWEDAVGAYNYGPKNYSDYKSGKIKNLPTETQRHINKIIPHITSS